MYWELIECLNIKISKYLCSNLTNKSNFQPLEVVGHGSQTQIQVGENLNLELSTLRTNSSEVFTFEKNIA